MATGVTDRQVEGINPVMEALRGPRRVLRVVISEGFSEKSQIEPILNEATRKNIKIVKLNRLEFEKRVTITVNQGILAETDPYYYHDTAELNTLAKASPSPLLLVLDRITDPQNFGAIIRVAEAAGVCGCVIAKNNAPAVTPAVAKASAGAVEHLRLFQVVNLTRELRQLKKSGFWIIGASEKAEQAYFELDLKGPIALVFGSEGRGISRLVGEECDFLAAIPMMGNVRSLNVSTACAAILFEAVRQRLAGEGRQG